jgi:hypothetical protein
LCLHYLPRLLASARARIGGMARLGVPADDPRYDENRRILIADKLTRHVEKVLTGSPKLTDEQLNRIASLLKAGALE